MTTPLIEPPQQQARTQFPPAGHRARRIAVWVMAGIVGLSCTGTLASDHVDEFDAAHDLTDLYAFKHPSDPGRQIVVLNYRPNAAADTRFSDDHEFAVEFAPVEVLPPGGKAPFSVGTTRYRFSCRFDKPSDDVAQAQTGHCSAANGESLPITFDDEAGSHGKSFSVFAGRRSDPFFMAAGRILKNFLFGSTRFPDPGSNTVGHQNVLSLVLEFDIDANLDRSQSPLFAIRSEVLQLGAETKRLDSVGRPEVTNLLLAIPVFDSGHRFSFINSKFNGQDTFLSERADKEGFLSRFNANLGRWDMLDGTRDWPLIDGEHPLSATMYRDYLVVDMTKPFQEKGFFEIESSIRAGTPHTTSGGRWLNEDVVDYQLTLYISAGREAYTDHVDAPTESANMQFPFLRSPVSDGD